MMFGNDGKLYITTGDGGTPDNAQDRKNNLGKLIRLEDDGSIPDDNPYTAANGYESYNCQKTKGKVPDDASDDAICSEIFALGLRNPFRMSMDPNEKEKTRFAISDVGGKVWEEINYAGTDYMAVNYGHNEYEGPCFRHSDQECPVPKYFEEPFYWYHHKEKQDGCVAGSAFVPEGLGWPEKYKFLFIDVSSKTTFGIRNVLLISFVLPYRILLEFVSENMFLSLFLSIRILSTNTYTNKQFVWYNIYSLIEDNENKCRNCVPPIPKFRNETVS
jgi:hypothetical protein